MQTSYEHFIEGLKNANERLSLTEIADMSGASVSSLSRWIDGKSTENIAKVFSVLDALGARIVFPEDLDGDTTQDIFEKNRIIKHLTDNLETCSTDRARLEGKVELLKEQLSDLQKEIFSLQKSLMIKEVPPHGSK